MKSKTQIITAACAAVLIFAGSPLASASPKKSSSPSASPSASSDASPGATSGMEKPARAIPFHGTATAVDQTAKTFTIAGKKESRVFKVTDKTTVTKDGQPASFVDLSDNGAVSGSYWKQADGTLEAKSLKIAAASSSDKTGSEKSTKSDAAAGAKTAASPSPSAKKK